MLKSQTPFLIDEHTIDAEELATCVGGAEPGSGLVDAASALAAGLGIGAGGLSTGSGGLGIDAALSYGIDNNILTVGGSPYVPPVANPGGVVIAPGGLDPKPNYIFGTIYANGTDKR